MTKKVLPFLFFGLITCWLIAIVFLYFFSINIIDSSCKISEFCFQLFGQKISIIQNSAHIYYFESFKSIISKDPTKNTVIVANPILLITLIFLTIYSLICLYFKYFKKKSGLKFDIKLYQLVIFFLVIFYALYFYWIYYFQLGSYGIKYPGIISHSVVLFSETIFILILTLSLGKKIFDLIFEENHKNKPDEDRKILYSFGLGVISITLILFVFGALNVLQSITIWTFFILIFIFSIKDIWGFIKQFLKIKIRVDTSFFNPMIFISFLLIVYMAQNALDLIRPFPVGYDDMARYMDRVKLISDQGKLINGYLNYPWELYLSSGMLLFKSQDSSIFLNFARNLFLIYSLIKLFKSYCASRNINKQGQLLYPMLFTLFFLSLPMTIFQTSKDLKVDMAGLFFVVIGTISFLDWKTLFKKGKGHDSLFLLSVLFIGFATCIKYTYALYLIVIGIYAIYILISSKTDFKHTLKLILLGLFFSCITFTPFAIQNIYKSHNVRNILVAENDNPTYKKIQDFYNSLPEVTRNLVKDTAKREEVERYAGYKTGPIKYLSIPFAVVFLSYVNGPYMDSSYIFLCLIPIIYLIWIFFRKGIDPQNKLRPLLAINFIYWFLWLFTANGIIWYGLGGFILMFLLLIEYFNILNKNRFPYLRFVSTFLLTIWLISSLILKFSYIPSYSNISTDVSSFAYARGISDENSTFSSSYRDFISIINQINSDIEKDKNNPPQILKVNSSLGYFINENNLSVIEDNQLDIFNKLNFDKDSEKTLERLIDLNIKYILVNTSTPTMDQTPEQSLAKKYRELSDFVNNTYPAVKIVAKDSANHTLILEIDKKKK